MANDVYEQRDSERDRYIARNQIYLASDVTRNRVGSVVEKKRIEEENEAEKNRLWEKELRRQGREEGIQAAQERSEDTRSRRPRNESKDDPRDMDPNWNGLRQGHTNWNGSRDQRATESDFRTTKKGKEQEVDEEESNIDEVDEDDTFYDKDGELAYYLSGLVTEIGDSEGDGNRHATFPEPKEFDTNESTAVSLINKFIKLAGKNGVSRRVMLSKLKSGHYFGVTALNKQQMYQRDHQKTFDPRKTTKEEEPMNYS